MQGWPDCMIPWGLLSRRAVQFFLSFHAGSLGVIKFQDYELQHGQAPTIDNEYV
jgi:hypothetical protein